MLNQTDPVLRAQIAQRIIDPDQDDAGKGQLVRLAQVFVLGPYMIWSGRDIEHQYLRVGMMLLGLGNIIYSGYNLLRIYKAQRGEGIPELAGARRGLRAPPLRELNHYNVNVRPRPARPRIW